MKGLQHVLFILVLGFPSSAMGQSNLEGVAGCYDVILGDWTPPFALGGDSLYLAPPSRVVLDTAFNAPGLVGDRRILSVAPGALPSVHRFSGWELTQDSVHLIWTNGFSGFKAGTTRAPGGFRGDAQSYWDVVSRQVQTASIFLEKVDCKTRPTLTREDQRSVRTSISIGDGSALTLREPFSPGANWQANSTGRAFTLSDATVLGFGRAREVEARVSEDGTIRSVYIRFPSDFPYEETVDGLTSEMGFPVSREDRSLVGGRRRMSAHWANRTESLWLRKSETSDGDWQILLSISIRGR
jgi:hypothetical protein